MIHVYDLTKRCGHNRNYKTIRYYNSNKVKGGGGGGVLFPVDYVN